MMVFVTGSLSVAQAQDFSLGPTIGFNYSWLSEIPGDVHALVGINAGLTMVYSSNEHWGLGVDLKYSGEGVVTKLGSVNATTHLEYIRVPVKIIYFFNNFEDRLRPKAYFGPAAGFLAGGKTELFRGTETIKVDSRDLYEDFDLGLILGAGFNYRIATRTWFNFDVAYSHGLSNISKTSDAFNRKLHLNLGVAFGL